MTWVLLLGTVWIVLAVVAALVIGRMISLADRRETAPLAAAVADAALPPLPAARREAAETAVPQPLP
jgi:hypothetical protein